MWDWCEVSFSVLGALTVNEEVVLPLAVHVVKHREQIVLKKSVAKTSVPIAYHEVPELDARRNLQLVDRTSVLPANRADELVWYSFTGTTYGSVYKRVLATNRTVTNPGGRRVPLFYRHTLPDKTVSVELEIISGQDSKTVDYGYYVDLEAGVIYTNYRNRLDRLYYVSSVDENGVGTRTLLNPEPAAKEAGWEDIDLSTGLLKTSSPLYSRVQTSTGYTYTFNISDTWYIRPVEGSEIRLELPALTRPEDPWYMMVSDGEFSVEVNGSLRRYYVPEYSRQPFIPYAPVAFSSGAGFDFVNSTVLYAGRKEILVDPDAGLHISIQIYEDGKLIRVLSTDTSLTEYEGITIETDKIASWDNPGGFISLNTEVDRNHEFKAAYYYKQLHYEFTSMRLNPLQNKKAGKWLWVFYLVPDVDTTENAVQLLGVDESGKIAYASQTAGSTLPNLQLRHADSSYNSSTVIGKSYNEFLGSYTVGYSNSFSYYVLGEVTFLDLVPSEKSFDLRRPPQGGKRVVLAQRSGALLVRPPRILLETFSQDLAETLLRRFVPSAVRTVFDWDYPESVVTGVAATNQIDLTVSWEGVQTHRLYRKEGEHGSWSLQTSLQSGTRADFNYSDTTVTSGQVYHYSVRILENGVEYPFSSIFSIQAK